MTPAFRIRNWLRNPSLASKIVAVTMGVSSAALLACSPLLDSDSSTARTGLTPDIAMLAGEVIDMFIMDYPPRMAATDGAWIALTVEGHRLTTARAEAAPSQGIER